ncbi:hypothetical protein WJX81_000910 [Elliptochloris bilobata]|uniref:Uncharacterized protein n=1 Tax=Elliptochloris bilobata TaxID=381761 RepID=A0AAW1RI22_9CHLO
MEWHEHVRQLAELPYAHGGKPQDAKSQAQDAGIFAVVRRTLSAALQSAKEDANWSSSGLPESLQRALDLCERGSVVAACTAAQNLLGFHEIVKRNTSCSSRNAGRSPPHGSDAEPGTAAAQHPAHTAAAAEERAGAHCGASGSPVQPAGADAASALVEGSIEAAEVAAERAARAARLVTSGSSGSGSPGIAEAFAAKPVALAASAQVTSGASASGVQRLTSCAEGGGGIQRAGGSGGSSNSDTSGSDTEKRFVAAAEESEAARPLKKRRLDVAAVLTEAAYKGVKIRERSLSEGAAEQLPIAPLRLSPLAKETEGSDGRTVVWAGKLKHRAAGPGGTTSTVELLAFSAAVPEATAEQLPPTLFVTRLAQRGAVRMAHHRLVQCRMGQLSERQTQKLQVLASAKLVAVCRLQHCQLTLVPYLEAVSGTLRMIGFLTGDDLGSPV